MRTSSRVARSLVAVMAAVAATTLIAGAALAQTQGEPDGNCVVTVEPSTVAVGQQFTVKGNFGGASIFIVPGTDGTIAEGTEPDATTPLGEDFSVMFTALGAGTYTVWGMIVDSGCGNSATLVVTAVPDTALDHSTGSAPILPLIGLLLLAPLATAAAGRAFGVRH
jgi:hypothetical protein